MTKKTDNKPKILHFDIETLPMVGTLWSLWEQQVGYNQLLEDWVMASWSAKWHDEEYVYSFSLSDSGNHVDHNDFIIIEELVKLIEQADMVVAHNGDKFDIKKLRTRMIYHGMPPLSPVKQYDTLKTARRLFKFSSNRLDYLGDFLGVGRKIDTGGHRLWMRCLAGERSAFSEMAEYNRQDVILLEDVYKALQPWDSSRLNVNLFDVAGTDVRCSNHDCQSKKVQSRGTYVNNRGVYRRFQCQDCGAWGVLPENLVPIERRRTLLK